MQFPNLKASKAGVILFSVLALTSFVLGFFYFTARAELNDVKTELQDKEAEVQSLKIENEDLQFKLIKATTLPTRSVNKTKPVKLQPKKKKPVVKKTKNKKINRNRNQVFYTSGINTDSPVVKLVVYESNGKTRTYTMNCYKERSVQKNSLNKVKKSNTRKIIARR
jgi:regulator of replication initiation timing